MLDIVIVNWNAGVQLQSCLESIAASSRAEELLSRVVVVDNASSDGSIEHISVRGLPLHIIRNEQNRGFAAACNQGATGSTAEYLLFLNPDTLLYPDTLERALQYMEHPQQGGVGVCGIKLRDELGRVARSSTRQMQPAHVVVAILGLDKLSPPVFRTHFMHEWDHEESRVVDHVIGAFYLIRRRLFETLGGFDERFFVYLEDLDLSLRVRRVGLMVHYFAGAEAYHRGGGTSEQAKAARLYYSLRSRILYGYKHFSMPVAMGLAAATLLLEPVSRCVWLVASGNWEGVRETMDGFKRLWSETPSLLSGRPGRLAL